MDVLTVTRPPDWYELGDGQRLIASVNGAPAAVLPRVAAAIHRVRSAHRLPTALRLDPWDRARLMAELPDRADLGAIGFLMGLPVQRRDGPSAVIWTDEEPLTPEAN